MKKLITIFFIILISPVFAVSPDSKLDPDLLAIFNQLTSTDESKELIGKKFSMVLSLKYATKKHLVFHDAYIRVSKGEKYQIARWLFDPTIISSVVGKNGIECTVEFIIKEVKTKNVYKKMPHIIVEIIKLNA